MKQFLEHSREESPLVIKDAVISDGSTFLHDPGVLEIRRGCIAYRGESQGYAPPEGARVISAEGRLLLPGLVNMHHHLYSSLAVGMAPLGETPNFRNLLEGLWWPLDQALGEEEIYLSALVGIMDSLRYGVTTLVDHHASMSQVRGSLDVAAQAMDEGGVRGLLCFECSERHSSHAFREHLEENIAFGKSHKNHPRLGALLGMHANFTISDEGLRIIAKEKPPFMPIHIHCGEDREDLDFCLAQGYLGPVDRLARHGLLDSKSFLAHCIHLGEKDYSLIQEYAPVVVTNPESNANNCVGAMDRSRIAFYCLGTDGMNPDMVQTLRSFFLLGKGRKEDFHHLSEILFQHPRRALKSWFSQVGTLDLGVPGDVVVLDYLPLTPVTLDNLVGHLLFGARNGRAWLTLGGGKVLYHQGHFPHLDEASIRARARQAGSTLRRRFYG